MSSRTGLAAALLATVAALLAQPVQAAGEQQARFKRISPQYIAALGDPGARAGTGAETWGLWPLDPGPRGVRLRKYSQLVAADGVAPARWTFDRGDWWLEEHGLIMEQPVFPLPPGRYLVTGDREVTTVLTVHPADESGDRRWELADGATLHDVTHLACRSARYRPASGPGSCSPVKARESDFPVSPGAAMPPVEGCAKQDYAVLIVIGLAAENP
jgi:hypothetical protein